MVSLIPNILVSSRQPNTDKTYKTYFNKWLKWSDQFNEVCSLPTSDQYISLFLTSLIQSGNTFSVIHSSYFAIKYYHSLSGYDNIGNSSVCKKIYEAAKRICNHVSHKKDPVKTSDLLNILHLYKKEGFSLMKLRTM